MIEVYEGEIIVMVFYVVGIRVFSYSGEKYRLRGFFCVIGKCFFCFVKVNGILNVCLCIIFVEDGMRIEM